MGLSEAEELELLTLKRRRAGFVPKAATPIQATGEKSLSEMIVPSIRTAFDKTIQFPLMNPVARKLERAGKTVNESVQGSADTMAGSGFPTIATAASIVGDAGELTPSNLSVGVGSEALPLLATPLARRAEILRRSVGNKFVGTPLPSLKKSMREGTEQLGEKFLNTKLPANRDEAFAVSSNIVDSYEKQIQASLDKASKSGRIKMPAVADETFTKLKGKLEEPLVLPSSGGIERFAEPKIGTIPRYIPEELNMQTAGRKFTKNESRGLFNKMDPEIEAKQISYLKEQRANDILEARNALKKRLADPEYSAGLKKEYAISRDSIASSIDKVIKRAEKTGLEKESVKALNELKDDFTKSHPGYADVQYWNDVKRAIYKRVGDKGYLSKNSTDKIEALRDVASGIRAEIERVIPGIKDLNSQQGLYLEIRNSLGDLIASRSKSNVGGAIKNELSDEALVRAARRRFAQNLPKTRGTSGIVVPALDEKR